MSSNSQQTGLPPRRGLKMFLGFLLRLTLGIALIVMAIRFVDVSAMTQAILSLGLGEFLLSFATSVIATIVIPALITRRTLQAGQMRLSLLELIQINLANRFYVLTMPHAISVGLRWKRYRDANVGLGWQAAALILFERAVQFLVVVAAAFICLLLTRQKLPQELALLLPLSGGLCLLGLALTSIFVHPAAFRLLAPMLNRATVRMPAGLAGRVGRFAAAVSDFQKLKSHNVGFVLLWSVTGHVLFVASAYVVTWGMGISVSFLDIAWMRSAVFLMTLLPITVGGLGIREVGFSALLYLYGTDKSVALAMPLILLSVQLVIGLVGALSELFRWLPRRWRK